MSAVQPDVAWFADRIEELLAREGTHAIRSDSGWFHPSSLSNPCDMAVTADFLGYTSSSTVDGRLQRIFDLGHDRDRAWKQYLKRAGFSLIGKQRADMDAPFKRTFEIPEWRIRGECDDIINDGHGNDWIAEIKTINRNQFDQLNGQPKLEHKVQTTCYMVGHGIPRALVVYERKDDGAVAYLPYMFDEALWHEIQQRIVTIINAINAGWHLERKCTYGCNFPTLCPIYNPLDALDRLRLLVPQAASQAIALSEEEQNGSP